MAERRTSVASPSPCKIKVQIYCGDEIAMGPGKADLLEAIAREGSISAAGRALGMSYRRTWLLVDAMNRCWDLPLVETALGGSKGGGSYADAARGKGKGKSGKSSGKGKGAGSPKGGKKRWR